MLTNKTGSFKQSGMSHQVDVEDILPTINCDSQMKHNPVLEDMLLPLINNESIQTSLSEFSFDPNNYLVSPLNNASISKAKEVLNKILLKSKEAEKYSKKSNYEDYKLCMEQIEQFNNDYLALIPRVFHKKIDIIKEEYQINDEISNLEQYECNMQSLRLALAASESKKLNPIDYVFESITQSLPMRPLDEKSDEFRLLLRFLNRKPREGDV